MPLADQDHESLSAYLFQRDDCYAVTLDDTGGNLPSGGHWQQVSALALSVERPLPFAVNPEPILRGIRAKGYYVWRLGGSHPEATTQ